MKNNESKPCLDISGITPVIIYGERALRIDAKAKRFITNKYIDCLYDICQHWDQGFYILDTLIRHSIIKQYTDYSMEWTLTKKSLAWLFRKRDKTVNEDEDKYYITHIPGGFWNPVGILFSVKKETLKRLAYNEKEYGGRSQDIEKLKTVLEENGIQL